MTAYSPDPCGCIPGHPACDCSIRTHREQGRRDRDDVGTAGGQLRAKIELAIMGRTANRAADAVLALPALRNLIAERDTLAAQVQAVEEVVRLRGSASYTETRAIRRALGTPTTEGRP